MKFTIKKLELLNALNKVYGVAEKHNAIEVLSNILIDSNDNKLSITSTDNVMEVLNTIECFSISNGKTTVNAYTFHDIIKRLDDNNEVCVELLENQLLITSGKSKFSIGVLPADTFPIMIDDNFDIYLCLSKDDLNLLINKPKYAVSGDELRYYLNGICVHSSGNGINAVATDGHRLALSRIESDVINLKKIIIPIKACNIVSKLIDTQIDDVTVAVSDNKIKFVLKDTVIITKLIDGNYPDYERIIPSNNELMVTVNTKDFIECVNRVSSVLDAKSNAIRLEFQNDILTIKSNYNQNSAIDELSCDSNNLIFDVGLNVKYLKDALSSIDCQNTVILLKDEQTAILIKPENNDNYTNVVMTLRV